MITNIGNLGDSYLSYYFFFFCTTGSGLSRYWHGGGEMLAPGDKASAGMRGGVMVGGAGWSLR